MSEIHIGQVESAEYTIVISIDAPDQRVWAALFREINLWWLADFRMLGTGSMVSFEPRSGGQLLEQLDERSLAWFTVIAVDPIRSVTSVGYCTSEFGGPSTSLLTLKLSASGKGTTLSIRDELIGKNAAAQARSLQVGWTQLFTNGLKRWIEMTTANQNS